uniref:GST C-terminal domain-containing protein n=1 Tax=Xenopus tropicalis TaxID=8364 RepID=A0A6I8Q8F9_XENTR
YILAGIKYKVIFRIILWLMCHLNFARDTAMILYLARRYKTPDHWYPSDPQKCAQVDEYLAGQHNNTSPNSIKVFWAKFMTPLILGHEAPCEKVDAILADFNNNELFIAEDEISVADLVAIVEIMQVVGGGVNAFDERPKLAAWQQRVAHKGILNSKKKKGQ